MNLPKFIIKEKVRVYSGEASWYYLIIPIELAGDIKDSYIWPRRGFGAIPVNLTIGKTSWKTSVFPEKIGTLMLPLKKEIRVKENIKEGDLITINVEVVNS
jgi:hypothetical protein